MIPSDMYLQYMEQRELQDNPPPSAGSWICEACQVRGLWQFDAACWNCGLDPRETIEPTITTAATAAKPAP